MKKNDLEIQKNGENSLIVSEEEKCIERIKHEPYSFRKLAKRYKTLKVCEVAIQNGGFYLRDVPEELKTKEICKMAVEQNGIALEYVPNNLKTVELCLCAIANCEDAFEYVPKELLNRTFYEKAFEMNKKVIEYLPKSCISKEFAEKLVKQDGNFLKYLKSSQKSLGICEIAVNNTPTAIQFASEKFKTKEKYLELLKKDYRVYTILPKSMQNKRNTILVLEQMVELSQRDNMLYGDFYHVIRCFSNRVHNYPEVVNYERKLKARVFLKKYYDDVTKKFTTVEKIKYKQDDSSIEKHEFDSFEEFVTFLNGDISQANLIKYDFGSIDLKKYDISKAIIDSDVLMKQGLYDSSYYEKTINDTTDIPYSIQVVESDLSENNLILDEESRNLSSSFNTKRIYYISDLHLNYRLKKAFPHNATKNEIMNYISDLIDDLVNSKIDTSNNDYLLVGGDISCSFELNRLFYHYLAKKWKGTIITILGNHELWNKDNEYKKESIDKIVDDYNHLFMNYENIIFLHNSIYIERYKYKDPYTPERIILKMNNLNQMTKSQIEDLCSTSKIIIVGGLGFSGYNDSFNATHGLYRNIISTRSEDKKQSDVFNSLYSIARKVFSKERIIVFTHTPLKDWTKEDYYSNWIYVNGHTHNDYYCNDNSKVVLADNQIGYSTRRANLKYFDIENSFDYFKYYKDGIYDISREQYLYFNRGINNIHCSFNRIEGKIIMIKRDSIYAFFYLNANNKLYLLNGGTLINVNVQELKYYYDKVLIIKKMVSNFMNTINSNLMKISNSIKKIGGSGTVHGLIVDIDFFNHIYYNPYDGKLSFYFATSIVDKVFFKDIESLLNRTNKELYGNYRKMIGKNESLKYLNNGEINKNTQELEIAQYVADTFMYTDSGHIKTLQYLTNNNVVRFWNDELIEKDFSSMKSLSSPKIEKRENNS